MGLEQEFTFITNEIKSEIIEVEYNCIHCQKSFSDIDELDYHEKINHVIIKEEPDWVIDEEEEPISNKKPIFEKLEEDPDWIIHEEEEPISNEKPRFEKLKEYKRPFSCSQCPKSFYTSTGLYKHTSSYHRTPTYKCHVCKKAFLHPSLLKNHLEDHKNLRKFKCYHCNSAFNTNWALRKHLKTQGVIPKKNKQFNCDLCEDTFRTGHEVIIHCVKKHSMDVSDVKPYKCNICSAAYSRSYNMYYHKRKTHKK